MKKILPIFLIFFTGIAFSIESAKPESFWLYRLTKGLMGDYCPNIPIQKFNGKCQAICPKNYRLYRNIDENGVYICEPIDYLGQAEGIKCPYFNPYCVDNFDKYRVEFPIGKIFRDYSYTELAIKIATLDPKLFEQIEKDISLRQYDLPYFVKAFNFLMPIFENIAYFLFEIAFILTLAIFTFKQVGRVFAKQKYGFDRPISDTISKSLLVFLFFALPIQPLTDTKDKPAPVPLGLELTRMALLSVNDLATYTSEKLIEIYANDLFQGTIEGLKSLETFYLKFNHDILTKSKKLSQEFQKECVLPYERVNGRKPKTFLVDDKTLKSYRFGTVNDFQQAVYCRNLEQQLDALREMYNFHQSQILRLVEIQGLISSKGTKLKQEIIKEAKKLAKKAGFLADGILLPNIHFFVSQKFSEEIIEKIKDKQIYTYGYRLDNAKGLAKQYGGVKAIIPASFILAIPPFDTIFKTLRDLLQSKVVDIVFDPIKTMVMSIGGVFGGIGIGVVSIIDLILTGIQHLIKFGATPLAFAITVVLALILLPIVSVLGISLAVIIRFIQFFIETVIFAWSIPFQVMTIFISHSEEALRNFVQELLKLTLLIILITTSPIFGLFVVTTLRILLLGIFGLVINELGNYTNLVGEIFVIFFGALLIVATHILSLIFGFTITYKAPDFMLEKMKSGITIIASTTERFYEGVSSKLVPRL